MGTFKIRPIQGELSQLSRYISYVLFSVYDRSHSNPENDSQNGLHDDPENESDDDIRYDEDSPIEQDVNPLDDDSYDGLVDEPQCETEDIKL